MRGVEYRAIPLKIKRFFLYLRPVFCYTRLVIMEFVYPLERRERPVKFKKWNIGSPKAEDVALLRRAGYP